MLILQNLLFYNLIYFVGRGFYLSFVKDKNIKHKKIFGIDISIFFPILTFFLLGNFSFLIHFFVPIKDNIPIFIISLFLLFNLKNTNLNLVSKDFLLLNILFPVVLGVTSYSVGFHYDSGLYHLNYQNWLMNEKIVFGISNIYAPFGFSSINEYILANFWFQNNFIFLHFVNLTFLNFFFSFIYTLTTKSKFLFYQISSYFIILFSVLDNFGIDGGRNGFVAIQGIGKVDYNFAICFFITFLVLIYSFIETKISFQEWQILSLLILFCIQLKVYGFTLLIFYFALLIKNRKNFDFRTIFKSNIIATILGVLWLLKSFIQTGCLVYPVHQLCFKEISWYSDKVTKLIFDTREFHNAYYIGENILLWFDNFSSKESDMNIIFNFLISLILLFVLKIVFFKSIKKNNIFYFSLIFVLFNFFLLTISAPTPRFFTPIFLVTISLMGFDDLKEKFKLTKSLVSNFMVLCFFLSLLLVPRISDYRNLPGNLLESKELSPKQISYISNEGWGVKPAEGEQCWININCVEEDSYLLEQKAYGYIIYELVDF